ncbi:CMGC/CK2 protein kinase [Thecamonas trahens ATCC 50062]|uniref:non-specific serine/threonine protein kinase n=1 Tax=Thecamonas trahens ATCC 50062 TaxID=461836 RepID=A0A0L0DRK4_THETB|nr:CMGC/CK2 protein kinase [Thecamonas trahens ATCC 50062]KNC54920.1 CMGC/CK2 protein kinase [Thecamonas trahens ATCC 50062]|eukprot:XP_013753509.1 CMGC/CK2 protein kinase [Thecamonas trahens ATCC 50062]
MAKDKSKSKLKSRSRPKTKAKKAATKTKAELRSKAKARRRKSRLRVVRPPWVLKPNDDGAFTVHWGSLAKYRFGEHLGSGSYGEVFLGWHKASGVPVALKEMREEEDERNRTRKEINTLLRIHDGPNIVRLYDTVRDREGVAHLVFEHVDENRWQSLYCVLSDTDIRTYMYKLFLALAYAHDAGVVHRDIKPANVLIDHGRRKVRLIDWGCAGLLRPGKSFTRFPGTRPYKAPELLLHIHQYGAAVDVWSAGIVFASMLFRRIPFFTGMQSDVEQLVLYTRLLGTAKLKAYVDSVGVALPGAVKRTAHKVKSFRALVTDDNHDNVSSSALNLLRRTLAYNPERRISAAAALEHEYFDPVRRAAEAPTASDDSAYDDDPGHLPAVPDDAIDFGLGFSSTGESSCVGYSSTSGSGSDSDAPRASRRRTTTGSLVPLGRSSRGSLFGSMWSDISYASRYDVSDSL